MRRQNESPLLMDPRSNSSDDAEFKLFLKMAEFAPRLGVDTESNGQDYRDGRGHATGISIAFSHDGLNGYSYYFPFRHEGGNLSWSYRDALRNLIESKPITCHSLGQDILALNSLGIKAPEDAHCSLLLAHNVNENYLNYSLDYLARHIVGIPGKMREDDFKLALKALGWGGIPAKVMAPYAARDAELHLEVHDHFWPLFQAEDESEGGRWQTELDFIHVLNTMGMNGIEVDLDLAEQEIFRGEFRMTELLDDIGYNLGSHKDLKKLLLEDLGLPVLKKSQKTGEPSFDKSVMEQYEELLQYVDSPVASGILEYRGYQKAVSSYWKPYLTHVSPDGRIRPTFLQHGTVNSRLSCKEPNGQQIPRVTQKPWNKKVKSGFVAREGTRLWEPDYSQLEMRIQAGYAKEPKLIEIFSDPNRDLFDEMSLDLGYPRYDVKQMTYAVGYGAQPPKVAAMLNISEAKAYRMIDARARAYPGLQKLSDMASATVKGQGYIRYWTGRRRHFEHPGKDAHKGLNSVMQGGAAEIMKRTQIRLAKELDPEECKQLLQIHDAIVFEIPIGKEKKHLPEIKRIMEDVIGLPEKPDFGVPFRVDVHEWGK